MSAGKYAAGGFAALIFLPLAGIVAFLPAPDPCGDMSPPAAGFSGPVAGIPNPEGPVRTDAGPIPANYLTLYQQSGGSLWPILAGIGWVETGHGANTNTSSAGAQGPMQFEPSTFAQYGQGDINNPADAIPAAWKLLNAAGPLTTADAIKNAIFSYNHDGGYVAEVLAAAQHYAQQYGGSRTAPAPAAADPAAADPASCPTNGPIGEKGAIVISGLGWTNPLPGSHITQHFGAQNGHDAGGHPGVDLSLGGTLADQEDVVAAGQGVVSFSGPGSGYGPNYVCIDHIVGVTTCYGHMNESYVHVGQQVNAGQAIGKEGWQGEVSPAGPAGMHLHFEYRPGVWGPVENPEALLQVNGVQLS